MRLQMVFMAALLIICAAVCQAGTGDERDIDSMLARTRRVVEQQVGPGEAVDCDGRRVRVFLFLGQSNMVGRGKGDEFPEEMRKPRNDILRLSKRGWVRQIPGERRNGPEISFARLLHQHEPDTPVGIIKVAIGGTGIRAFLPEWDYDAAEMTGDGKKGPIYRIIREKIEQAKRSCEPSFEGVFWKQDAADMKRQETANGYLGHLQTIIEALRRDTGNQKLPLFVGTYFTQVGLDSSRVQELAPRKRPAGLQVLQAHLDAEEKIPHTVSVIHGRLPCVAPGDSHFNTEGQVILGRLFYEAFVEYRRTGGKKKGGRRPEFRPVKDNPMLPRVLLIGDSISIGYTIPVRKRLAGRANVHRPLTNCAHTRKGLEELDKWLDSKEWDVIHFNWGLHDLKYIDEKGRRVPPSKGKQQIPIEQYEKNLEKLVIRLKKTGAKLIWAATTPVPEGAGGRIKGDAVRYNAVAEKIMKKHGVMINNLYACVEPHLEEAQRPANVHFNDKGNKLLADQVTEHIVRALGE